VTYTSWSHCTAASIVEIAAPRAAKHVQTHFYLNDRGYREISATRRESFVLVSEQPTSGDGADVQHRLAIDPLAENRRVQ
jgi:hypothetical protein